MDRPLYYVQKKKVNEEATTEAEMATAAEAEADGWIARRCKQYRRKQKQKLTDEKDVSEKGGKNKEQQTNGVKKKKKKETTKKSQKTSKREEEEEEEEQEENDKRGDENEDIDHNNEEENVDNNENNEVVQGDAQKTTSSKAKKNKKKTTSKKDKSSNKPLVDVLSRVFSTANRQQIEEVIRDMNLTSFDPSDGPLRSRILTALIEKQQQRLVAPESDSENYESEEKMHVEAEPVQETPQGDSRKFEEIPSEQVSEDNKQKKKRRKKPKRRTVEEDSQAVDSSGVMTGAANDEQENETGAVLTEEKSESKRNAKNVLLRELNAFEPSDARSVEQLLKWKSQMEQNPTGFIHMFNELKGLEILIDKWIYCNQFRTIFCEREFVELLSWLLPGDRDYHEYVMSQIIEICKCLETLSSDKKKEMRDIISNHCKRLLQVQTMHGYYTSGAGANIPHTATSRQGLQVGDSFLPKPSSLLPDPGLKDPLSNKIRELDTTSDNLTLIFQALRQQQIRVEQMKPTRNDSFRKVCNSIKTDMTERINGLTNERVRLQNQLQLIEHERKAIDSNINRALNPMQLEANQIASDIRVFTIQQKECEKKLLEINNMLEQLNLKHKQLNDKIHQVKSQYAPKEEQLHSEHQNYSFQNVVLEKENKCYEYLIQLADESWRKLEEWSNDRMEKHRDEGELCETQFMDQCMNYAQLLVENRTFLLNRVEHLKQLINNTIQHQVRTKQLYGETLAMNSANINGDINVYKSQIAFDTQVLDWIEEQVKQVVMKCRDSVRVSLFQRFLSQISVVLNNGGFPTAFLDQFNQDIYGGNMGDTRAHLYGNINVNFSGNPKIPPMNANTHIIGNINNPNATNATTINPTKLNPTINTAISMSTAATNANTNIGTAANNNLNINATSSRRPPIYIGTQPDSLSQQPQIASHPIPVVPKRGPIVPGRDASLIPNASSVTKQTQTTTSNNATASTSQNDGRTRNNQRRTPLQSETHRQ